MDHIEREGAVPALFYGRTAFDGGPRDGIADQRDEVSAFATPGGYRLVRGYSDRGRSGMTSWKRPGLQALFSDIHDGGPKVVIVSDVDRLARNAAALFEIMDELAKCAVPVLTPRGPVRWRSVAAGG